MVVGWETRFSDCVFSCSSQLPTIWYLPQSTLVALLGVIDFPLFSLNAAPALLVLTLKVQVVFWAPQRLTVGAVVIDATGALLTLGVGILGGDFLATALGVLTGGLFGVLAVLA